MSGTILCAAQDKLPVCQGDGAGPRGPHREEQAGERELPQVSKDYRKLYLMSMRARYRNGHRLVDSRRRLAVEKVDRIDGLLPF